MLATQMNDLQLEESKESEMQDLSPLIKELQLTFKSREGHPDFLFAEGTSADKLRREFYLQEMGFTIIVEALIESFKHSSTRCLLGHNMMYDILFIYRQFIGKLPDTYAQFVEQWYARFPRTYDTKVLAHGSGYFDKSILGNVYERARDDRKVKDILKFKFDIEGGFVNYSG